MENRLTKSDWTPEKKKEAFEKVITKLLSEENIRTALKRSKRKSVPSYKGFIAWLKKDIEQKDNYLFACNNEKADKYFDRIIEIASNVRSDRKEIDSARLKIETYKWVLSKQNIK